MLCVEVFLQNVLCLVVAAILRNVRIVDYFQRAGMVLGHLGSFGLHSLDELLEVVVFQNEGLLVLLVVGSVLLDLGRCCLHAVLEIIAGVLGLADHGPVLLEVFFNIVEDSELFVEADEQVFMVVELICHELVFVF